MKARAYCPRSATHRSRRRQLRLLPRWHMCQLRPVHPRRHLLRPQRLPLPRRVRHRRALSQGCCGEMKLMKKLALQQGQSPAIDLNSSMRSIAAPVLGVATG